MSTKGGLLNLGVDPSPSGWKFNAPIYASAGVFSGLGGKVYYVDAENGSDNNDGRVPSRALATVLAAYNKCVEDKHDCVVMIGTSTSFTISDTLTWEKRHTHLLGIAAPTPNSRARITVTGTDSTVAGLAVTADGCIFANFRIYQETSLAGCGAISVSGDRNYFFNVDIQGQVGTSAKGSATAYSLLLNGAEECRFENCTIGLDTVVRTAGSPLRLDGSAARNEFHRCMFRSACETASQTMVKFVDTAALDRNMWFKDCLFYNFWTNHADKLAEVFTIPSGATTHDIILQDCAAIGIDEWAASDRGSIWVVGGTPAAGTAGSGSTGIGVEPS